MLVVGPENASQKLKIAFQNAVAIENWQDAYEIGCKIKQGAFTFMEQVDLILLLAQQDQQTATKLLRTNVFSQAFVMVGLTQPNITSLESSPYFIPEIETELRRAVIQRRINDATKIRQCAKWCIRSSTWDEIADLERQLLTAPSPTYLPRRAGGNAPANIQNETPPHEYPRRRFTH